MWSCACAPAPPAERGVAKHCQPFDRKPHIRDWPRRRNPIIAPVPVLARHANDQLLDLSLDPRSARALTGLRAIEFAGDQLAVPGQDSVRAGDSCDLTENLAAQAMTDLAERGPLGVRELQPPVQLDLQDAVFGG